MCLVCSLLCGVSLVADAEEQTIEDLSVHAQLYLRDVVGEYKVIEGVIYPEDDMQQIYSYNVNDFLLREYLEQILYYFISNNGEVMFQAGKNYDVKISNIYHKLKIADVDLSKAITSASIYLYYADGTGQSISADVQTGDYNGHTVLDVSFSLNPEKDVKTFLITMYGKINNADYGLGGYKKFESSVGEAQDGVEWITPIIDVETKTEGLLSGILGKLQEVKDNISNVITSITELPQKIWSFIENGLKSLFVPDEQYIVEYKDKWDTLLENKLGAVYEVANVTFESWDRVQASDEQDTIEMPEVTIPLPEDNEFSFGGYDVKIVPDGFEFLATAVKMITAVVCTLAFVNGLRKRYDEVMGVEQ